MSPTMQKLEQHLINETMADMHMQFISMMIEVYDYPLWSSKREPLFVYEENKPRITNGMLRWMPDQIIDPVELVHQIEVR